MAENIDEKTFQVLADYAEDVSSAVMETLRDLDRLAYLAYLTKQVRELNQLLAEELAYQSTDADRPSG